MPLFFELEVVYIVIGIFILIVTAIATTYPDDMSKGAFKKGMLGVGTVLTIMIVAHYYITTARMEGVKEIFNNGETIICENKMQRTISRSVLISKELGWRLDGHLFKSDDHVRDFHTSRCIEFDGIVPK